jgi:hypothetical protein
MIRRAAELGVVSLALIGMAAVFPVLPVLAAREATLPAGTVLPVRFETTISSASSRAEDKVLAVVRENVLDDDGSIVIPAGSELRGRVVSARRAGKVKGRSYLAVSFDSVEVNGRVHRVATNRLGVLGRSGAKKDAAIIGGGTGAGALVGAITGGKGGAGKGALIGGATGTGVVLATRGPEVVIPAGARYRVRLADSFIVSR